VGVACLAGAKGILAEMRELRTVDSAEAFVFPGSQPGQPLSIMATTMALRRMKRGDLTVYGFRPTFRDWVGEATATPWEVVEAALAHTLADKTEAAYARGDLFPKRVGLLDQWARFCTLPPRTGNVSNFPGAAATA
jgi:integrase